MTHTPPPEQTLATLGLTADRLAFDRGYPPTAAHAWAAEPPASSEAGARIARAQTSITRLDVPALDELLVVSTDRRGFVGYLPAVVDHHPADAVVDQTEDLVLLESPDDLYVLLRAESGEHLVRRDHDGGFTVWRVHPRAEVLPDVVLADLAPIRCPPFTSANAPADLRLSTELSKWLDETGASPDPLAPLAAAGQLIRAWAPATPAERSALLEARMRGGSLPSAVAVEGWLASLADDELEALEAAAVDRAMTLCATVDETAALDPESDEAEDLIALLIPEREALAAVRVTLSRRRRGRALTEALRTVDAHVTSDVRALASILEVLPRWMADASTRFETDPWWVDR